MYAIAVIKAVTVVALSDNAGIFMIVLFNKTNNNLDKTAVSIAATNFQCIKIVYILIIENKFPEISERSPRRVIDIAVAIE